MGCVYDRLLQRVLLLVHVVYLTFEHVDGFLRAVLDLLDFPVQGDVLGFEVLLALFYFTLFLFEVEVEEGQEFVDDLSEELQEFPPAQGGLGVHTGLQDGRVDANDFFQILCQSCGRLQQTLVLLAEVFEESPDYGQLLNALDALQELLNVDFHVLQFDLHFGEVLGR